ncbi:MAG: SDR family oxidoreductase [Chitinophagales bacterium]|nr:SDR family oxidoreductase [Bacteroidota bacterium]MCB9044292.1 SDR family oxidoreductase [Chitinophagales bacterium]
MDINLQSYRAVVCGSTQGIGLASAQMLASLGASVILFARNEAKMQQIVSELSTQNGQKHTYLCADFSKVAAVEKALQDFLAKDTAPVHILINNTGGPAGGPIAEAPLSAFSDAFEKHVLCNQAIVQALLPRMQQAAYGRIVNIISTSVKAPINGLGVSNTIRAAVANWAKTLANEVAHWGITVNNVLPGYTETQRLTSIIYNKAQQQHLDTAQVADSMKAGVPMQRFARAEEIASAVAFLCTPAAAYINGINLPVDGGRTDCL